MRREAARAVMHSEQRFVMTQERLTLALSTGGVAIYDWDIDSDRLSIQGPLSESLALPSRDAAHGSAAQLDRRGIHPDDRDTVMAGDRRTAGDREPFEAEYRVQGGGHPAHRHCRVGTSSPGRPARRCFPAR